MRVAGVWTDGHVGPLLGANASFFKFPANPLLEIVFGDRFLLADAVRRVLESLAHDAIDGRARLAMRFELLGRPAGFVFLD